MYSGIHLIYSEKPAPGFTEPHVINHTNYQLHSPYSGHRITNGQEAEFISYPDPKQLAVGDPVPYGGHPS